MPSLPLPQPTVGPLGGWLLHPGDTQRRWVYQATQIAAGLERPGLLVVAVGLPVAALCLLARELRQRRWATDGRWLAIIPPADPTPAGALTLWRLLHPLLRARRGWAGRRPPVAFELIASPGRLRIGLWISATLSTAAITQAVVSAWPGVNVSVAKVPPVPSRHTSGGRALLATADWYPLAAKDTPGADPMLGIFDVLADCSAGETIVVQILARPATSQRVRRARTAGATIRRGSSQRRLSRQTAAGPLDPVSQVDVRDITAKVIAIPHYQVAIQYAVSGGEGRAARDSRQRRLRQISSGLALFTGRNHLLGRRMSRPASTIGGRRLRRSFLLSTAELALLAHLPAEPARYGLPAAPARQVAAPQEVPHA